LTIELSLKSKREKGRGNKEDNRKGSVNGFFGKHWKYLKKKKFWNK
jgi:hypothetical protein